jgi:hypothetical protein
MHPFVKRRYIEDIEVTKCECAGIGLVPQSASDAFDDNWFAGRKRRF